MHTILKIESLDWAILFLINLILMILTFVSPLPLWISIIFGWLCFAFLCLCFWKKLMNRIDRR